MSLRYEMKTSIFNKIPGSPLAYWISTKMANVFNNPTLYNYSYSPSQNITGNNERFVRKWWEIYDCQVDKPDEYIFYAKGGGFRKWYGNLDDIVNWTPEARHIYQYGDGKHASQIINRDYWYKKGITWGLIASGIPSFRVMPEGATFDKGGSTVIVDDDIYEFIMALLNSCVYTEIVSIFNPTLNNQVKDIRNLPLNLKNKESVDKFSKKCIEKCKDDWDSFETSWDFKKHPLI